MNLRVPTDTTCGPLFNTVGLLDGQFVTILWPCDDHVMTTLWTLLRHRGDETTWWPLDQLTTVTTVTTLSDYRQSKPLPVGLESRDARIIPKSRAQIFLKSIPGFIGITKNTNTTISKVSRLFFCPKWMFLAGTGSLRWFYIRPNFEFFPCIRYHYHEINRKYELHNLTLKDPKPFQ